MREVWVATPPRAATNSTRQNIIARKWESYVLDTIYVVRV